MAKEYEMLFRLSAKTDAGYTKAFREAQQELKDITKRIQELEQEIDAIVMEKVSKISKYQIFIK